MRCRRALSFVAASKPDSNGSNGADDEIAAAKQAADKEAPPRHQDSDEASSRTYRELLSEWFSLR